MVGGTDRLELDRQGLAISRRTVSRHLVALGLNRRRFIDPCGQSNRAPQRIIACRPGHMVHVDVKRSAASPTVAAGGSTVRAAFRPKPSGGDCRRRSSGLRVPAFRGRWLFAAGLYRNISATKRPLPQSDSCTAPVYGSPPTASTRSNESSPTTAPVTAPRIRSRLARGTHQRITPYTPRHNGKVERYNRILAEEFLDARSWTSEAQRAEALKVWNIHFNYHRPHSAAAGQPPASRLATGVTNVMASYS